MKTLIVKKPWGQFEQFTHNENTTVKIISLNPHTSISLQFHKERSEFWYIILGHPIITIGEKKINAKPGDEFSIEKMERHRIEAGDENVKFLEICHGNFDEEDIIRIEDQYGRV
jgi:mannose-6-phosphate isomerase-like protein (cupin superfamily)